MSEPSLAVPQRDHADASPGTAGSPHTHEAGTRDWADLVARAQAGESAALDHLLKEARPRAMAVAMKVLRNPVDAEDAVQDALLKLWRSMPRFEARASFFTWLHRIVMNASVDLLRRERARGGYHDEAAGVADAPATSATAGLTAFTREGHREAAHDDTPERQLGMAETGALVRDALVALSPTHSEALRLRELEEHSYDEIAAVVRCPVGTVMSRLHHARRRLAAEVRSRVPSEELWQLSAA